MKTIKTKQIILVIFLLVGVGDSFSQGFVNLDFESAEIMPDPDSLFYPYGIVTTNALPGWSVYIGLNQATSITYNSPAGGSTFVSLFATNGNQISGKNSVLLQGGFTASAATISQTALVPISTVSLLFAASGSGALVVSLGGLGLNVFALSTGPNYTLYGADVSAFAGQTQQLLFSALFGVENNWNIDNIQFSTQPVPEPSTFALAALGGLLLGFRRWKK